MRRSLLSAVLLLALGLTAAPSYAARNATTEERSGIENALGTSQCGDINVSDDGQWAKVVDPGCEYTNTGVTSVVRKVGDTWEQFVDLGTGSPRMCFTLAPMPEAIAIELRLCSGDDLVLAAPPGRTVTMLGPLRPGRHSTVDEADRNASFSALEEAFGPASRIHRFDRSDCTATWRSLGLEAEFLELTLIRYGRGPACGDPGGHLYKVWITSSRWRTAEGLRVGDRLRRLRRLYPHAARHPEGWWLSRTRIYPTLIATVRGGVVRKLFGFVNAASQ